MPRIIGVCSTLIVGLAVLGWPGLARQQNGGKPPSPPASAECKFADGKTIHTDYSSPRLRGRKMIGDHDPYGKPWRAGANAATTFVTTANLSVDGKQVPAGSYTLFVIPNPDKWTLIISKKTGEWGIPYPGEQYELGRYDMKLETLPSSIEDFTISYTMSGPTSCTLGLEWDTTRASITLNEQK
jgi:Protein of unknown function (DUF2911)